jgi:ribonuclease-3 family protein
MPPSSLPPSLWQRLALPVEGTPPPVHTLPYSPKLLAHLGDAVFEVLVRERCLATLPQASSKEQHAFCVARCCAEAQVALLEAWQPTLNEEELELVRRARNSSVRKGSRANQADYRGSTAFEALVGYCYLFAPQRLAWLSQALAAVAN